MIVRTRYLDILRPFIDKPLIKVISGVRRCGKSTFLLQIASFLKETGVKEENILVINKELLEFDFIKTYTNLHDFIQSYFKGKRGRHYLFVDEVQDIEAWERCIASLLAEANTDIYISGSNARLLSSDLATLLTGRYIQIMMHPFSYREFSEMVAKMETSTSAISEFDRYIKFGGFPGLHSLGWEETPARQFLESLYNTILLKDIVVRYNVRDVYMLEKISNFLISNCGSITSANKISAYVKSQHRKISVDTVQNYIAYTRNALLTHQVKRYDLKGKRILESLEKYYLCDTGLRYALMGYPPENVPGNLENIVLLELLSRGYSVSLGKLNGFEVDFIAEKGSEKIYFQVCMTLKEEKTIQREYRPLEAIDDHFPKYVLSLDQGFETSLKGVQWMNIKDFLLQE
ncbi:MAG: ATP-binding protein [Bacteroidales bacterium]|nr:ATP-binding protein [Bacteroidales bacterium]